MKRLPYDSFSKYRSGPGGEKGLFGFLLMILVFCFLTGRNVQAEPLRVDFNNGSGSFLLVSDSGWFLKNAEGNPLTGVQYLSIPKTEKIYTGYYYFDESGRLVRQRTVYYIRAQKANKKTFNGYYCTDSTGRFMKNGGILIRLRKVVSSNNKSFDGIFYRRAYGKISAPATVRYVKAQTVSGKKISEGWYYFNANGKMCEGSGFRTLDCQVDDTTFQGTYYFGTGGALHQKAGIIAVNGKKYCLDETGRRYENCGKKGYYWRDDGSMALSGEVRPGIYVDCRGKKCRKNEVALSSVKYNLQSMLSGIPGTWSVYIEDVRTGDVVQIDCDKKYYSASIIKLYCMACVCEQIRDERLSYTPQVRKYLESMIKLSDNSSYNALVALLGQGDFKKGIKILNQYIKDNGYEDTEAHHTCNPAAGGYISDGSGLQNNTSAYDAGQVLKKIIDGSCVNSDWSETMLKLLLGQTRRWKIPAGIPSGIRVANKTGENDLYGVEHDTAIVFAPRRTYILCIFSSGGSNAVTDFKKISAEVYRQLN